MFDALVAVLVLNLPFLVWLFVIRRYCVRNGMAYMPGANWGVTMWVDWQEASELAKVRADRGIVIWCRVFLWSGLLMTGIYFLGLLAAVV